VRLETVAMADGCVGSILDGMLEQARKRLDIEWVLGDLASVKWEREFDLVVMTGHAFQVFVDDREIHAALQAIHSALTDEGRFAFDTRNPLARAWEAWTPEKAVQIVDETAWRMAHQVDEPVDASCRSPRHTRDSALGPTELSRSRSPIRVRWLGFWQCWLPDRGTIRRLGSYRSRKRALRSSPSLAGDDDYVRGQTDPMMVVEG
jgi:SAM-dependent methyltransferase